MRKTYIRLALIIILAFAAFFVVMPKYLLSLGNTASKVGFLRGVSEGMRETSGYFKTKYPFRLGLDLQGGSHLVYKVKTDKLNSEDKARAVESLTSVIRERVDEFGVAEPNIYSTKRSGEDFLVVELPGVKDLEAALALIGKTARLEFKVEGGAPDPETNLPNYVSFESPLTGEHLTRASVVSDPNTGLPQVSLEFNDEGAKIFGEMTRKNLNKTIAIYLDDTLISSPRVQTQILDGRAVITGVGDIEEAKQLSIQLNAGALPVPVELAENRTVGATLGEQSVDLSVAGGLIGILGVVVFMVLYYRFPGILAAMALAIYTFISLALFKGVLSFILPFTPVTMTLAGIAGFILSIGMAVDANILIFERIKEELRDGKLFEQAVETGFKRAWSSIKDSNVSSLITTFILFVFGTGLIRGFAVTLAIGILVSMFTAISVTRTFLRFVTHFKWGRIPALYGIKIRGDR